MRPYYVWKVAYKELLSTFRDRRTLRSTILIPLILIPLFTVGLPLLLGQLFSGQQTQRQTLGVVGLTRLPQELRARLTQDTKNAQGVVTGSGVTLRAVTDALAAVRSGQVDAAIALPENLPARAGEASSTVKLYTKLSNLKASAGVTAKVQTALRDYNTTLVASGLRRLGLGTTFLSPVKVDTVDASTAAERRGGQLAFIIPMFMLQFILAGAMATAIDSTAGEKERGTLEVLLVSPVRRIEVVVGKLLATTLFAILTAAFSVLGLALAGPLSRLLTRSGSRSADVQQALGGSLSLGLGDLGVLIVMVLSVALLISGVLIAVAIFARSYKEAQTYVAPISIFIVIPAVMLQFADFLTRGLGLYAIPLVNAMLVILDLVKGALNAPGAALAILVNLAATAVVTALALRSFGREQVIFRN